MYRRVGPHERGPGSPMPTVFTLLPTSGDARPESTGVNGTTDQCPDWWPVAPRTSGLLARPRSSPWSLSDARGHLGRG